MMSKGAMSAAEHLSQASQVVVMTAGTPKRRTPRQVPMGIANA